MMKPVFPLPLAFCCPSCRTEHGFRSLWQPWCPECIASVERWPAQVCPRCGREQTGGGLCGTCQGSPAGQWATLHLFRYEGVVRDMIHAYKFSFWFFLGRSFGAALQASLQGLGTDFEEAPLVPVPTRPLRRLARRFDPVGYLARWLGRYSGRPVLPILQKCRTTPPQSGLPRSRRLDHSPALYRCRSGRMPSRAILVDDVYTTGSTASACIRALVRDGIPGVALLTLSRTP